MAATLADLKEIGTRGPYNFSKLKFKVTIDVDGKYHLSNHKSIKNTSPRTSGVKSACHTFAQIADCCARVLRWDNGDDYQRVSASYLLRTREGFIKRSEQLRQYGKAESAPLTSLEIYNLVLSLAQERDPSPKYGWSASTAPPHSEMWMPEYERLQDAAIAKLTDLFKTSDQSSLVETFINDILSDFSLGVTVSPVANKIFADSRKKIVEAFQDPTRSVLGVISLPGWALTPSNRTLLHLYRVEGTEFALLPPAMAQYLLGQSLILEHTPVGEEIDLKTLEALKVLYSPFTEGPYRKLSVALKAARVL